MRPEEVVTFTREEIYERIWKEPLQRFAHELGLSDVALAKTCAKLDVPRPPRGYWARHAAGEKVRRTPLPRAKPGASTEACFQKRPEREPDPLDELVMDALAREERPEARIDVPDHLTAPHPLVRLSAEAFRKTKLSRDGRVECTEQRCLAVHVSPEALPRALRVMDALVKALEARGLPVEVTPPEPVGVWMPGVYVRTFTMPITRVKIDTNWVPFCIEELLNTTDLRKTEPSTFHRERYLRRPNGRLRLRIRDDLDGYRACTASPRRWTDGGSRRIERHLNAFIVAIHVASASVNKARIARERRRLEEQDRQRRLAEEQRAAREEEERRKRIDDEVRRWRLARDVRAFVADARSIVQAGHCEITPGGDIDVWLRWCEAHADAVDPLRPLQAAVAERMKDHAATCERCQKAPPTAK